MLLLLFNLFGCSKNYVFKTSAQPPYTADSIYALEDKCLVEYVEGCEKIKNLNIAYQALMDLHVAQMKEMTPLILEFNELLNAIDKPPILNLNYQQPSVDDWTEVGQMASIDVETRVQYPAGLDRMDSLSSEALKSAAKQIETLRVAHETAFSQLQRRYSRVALPLKVQSERLAVKVTLKLLRSEYEFEMPALFVDYLNRSVEPFKIYVGLYANEKDSYRILGQEHVVLRSPLTIECSGLECIIQEDEQSRVKFEHSFSFVNDESCNNLRPEVRVFRQNERPLPVVSFSAKY